MSALVALDLGSTGVRALLLDESGAVRARAYRPLGSAFPAPGRVEQSCLTCHHYHFERP